MKKLALIALTLFMVFALAACQSAPAAQRPIRREPIPVTENYATAETVGNGTDKTPASDTTQQSAPTSDTQASASATPATGDSIALYVAFAVGLILISAGGLLLLRRI